MESRSPETERGNTRDYSASSSNKITRLLTRNVISSKILLKNFKFQCESILRTCIDREEFLELYNSIWSETLGSDQADIPKFVKHSIKKKTLAKILNDYQYAPWFWQRLLAYFTPETEQQKLLKSKIENFTSRITNQSCIVKINDPKVVDGDFLESEVTYNNHNTPVAYAVGSTYRKKEEGKFKKPTGEVKILDAAEVNYANDIIVASIGDGHSHGIDDQQRKNIKKIASIGCKEANRKLLALISDYWTKNTLLTLSNDNDDSEEESNQDKYAIFECSPKLYNLMNNSDKGYQPNEALNRLTSEVIKYMVNKKPNSNDERAGVTTYAAKIDGNCLRVTGFAVGDQMLIGYSPFEESFFNISHSTRVPGGPASWSEAKYDIDSLSFMAFDMKLPKESIIIGLTDGVFDMLHKKYIKTQVVTDDQDRVNVETKILNIEEMKKSFSSTSSAIGDAKGLRDFFLNLVNVEISSNKKNTESKNGYFGDDTTIVVVSVKSAIEAEQSKAIPTPYRN